MTLLSHSMIQSRTPLHHAASSGETSCVQELISHGADVRAEDNEVSTSVCNVANIT